jgi:hypothetical protein
MSATQNSIKRQWLLLILSPASFCMCPYSPPGVPIPGDFLYHLSHSVNPFGVGYLWNRVLLPDQAGLDCHPPICVSWVARMTGMCHSVQPLVEM